MDPVARQIEMSMDLPASSGTIGSDGAMQNTSLPATKATARSITGSWQMDLASGEYINLTLSQSENMVFGRGSVTSGATSQWATASGSVSGSILWLNVVPADGARLYALSLDLSGQTPAKTYRIFSAGASTSSGTVKKVSYTTWE